MTRGSHALHDHEGKNGGMCNNSVWQQELQPQAMSALCTSYIYIYIPCSRCMYY